MDKQRLLELAGAPVTETRDTFKAKGHDPFRAAVKTIAQHLAQEVSVDENGDYDDTEVGEMLGGRWIEMVRDEINDILQGQYFDKSAPDLDPYADSEMTGGKEQEETITHDYMQANPDPSKTL